MDVYQWGCMGMIKVERNHFGVQQYVCVEDAEHRGEPDMPRARSTDPETSHAAARKARTNYSKRDKEIHGWLTQSPRNSWEVAVEMDVPLEHISSRFASLERAGLIRKTGEKRPGHSGWALANVYEAI